MQGLTTEEEKFLQGLTQRISSLARSRPILLCKCMRMGRPVAHEPATFGLYFHLKCNYVRFSVSFVFVFTWKTKNDSFFNLKMYCETIILTPCRRIADIAAVKIVFRPPAFQLLYSANARVNTMKEGLPWLLYIW